MAFSRRHGVNSIWFGGKGRGRDRERRGVRTGKGESANINKNTLRVISRLGVGGGNCDITFYRSIYRSIYRSAYLSIALSIYRSIYRSIDRSIDLTPPGHLSGTGWTLPGTLPGHPREPAGQRGTPGNRPDNGTPRHFVSAPPQLRSADRRSELRASAPARPPDRPNRIRNRFPGRTQPQPPIYDHSFLHLFFNFPDLFPHAASSM